MHGVPPSTPRIEPVPTGLAVLIVDDQTAVREGLVALIAAACIAPRGVYGAATCDEALSAMRLHAPDLIVLDIDLAGDDGLALIGQLQGRERVLVLSANPTHEARSLALAVGAAAFVGKGEPAADLLSALRSLAPR